MKFDHPAKTPSHGLGNTQGKFAPASPPERDHQKYRVREDTAPKLDPSNDRAEAE